MAASFGFLLRIAEGIGPLPPAMNDGRSLSHASVHSDVYDYEKENGRTYHAYKAGRYPLPNDVEEQSRMNSKLSLTLLSLPH
jgi:hypothetical protein